MSRIKSMYVDSLTYGRVKKGESEQFRIDNGVRQGWTMSSCFSVMKEMKMGMGSRGVKFMEEGREWRLHGLLCVYDLVLCGESEEDLRRMVGRLVKVCRRRGLKINAGKRKVMVMNGEEEMLL